MCIVHLLSGMHWPITNLKPSQHFLLQKQRRDLLEELGKSALVPQLTKSVSAFVKAQMSSWIENTSTQVTVYRKQTPQQRVRLVDNHFSGVQHWAKYLTFNSQTVHIIFV